MDLSYGESMDFEKSGCFLFFGSMMSIVGFFPMAKTICPRAPNHQTGLRFGGEWFRQPPRMCMHLILNQVINAFNLLAPVCGSWSAVSRGSTHRSFINPMGHQEYNAVSFGNRMVSRFPGCKSRKIVYTLYNACTPPQIHGTSIRVAVGHY